jgi:hypothetical protein
LKAIAERAYFLACLALGRLLRAAKYSQVARHESQVRKRRASYAPFLIWLSVPLMRLLDTGVRVLPQREWHEREREIYRGVYGAAAWIDVDDTLVLPCFPGNTLAAWLEDAGLDESGRQTAIELATAALADFHRLGFTHGDAMAENVMVDLKSRTARWFDFETIHESTRHLNWRRADDVRALLSTCLVRTAPERLGETLQVVIDVYADEEVTRLVAEYFSSAFRRSLTYHLGQAALSCRFFRTIGGAVALPRRRDRGAPGSKS